MCQNHQILRGENHHPKTIIILSFNLLLLLLLLKKWSMDKSLWQKCINAHTSRKKKPKKNIKKTKKKRFG
jgi:hypothetical protein